MKSPFDPPPGRPAPFSSLAVAALLLVLAAPLATPLVAPLAAQPSDSDEIPLRARLDQRFAEAYPDDGPGAAVIVTRNGETVLREAYGMADLELGVPLEPDMVFRLGSVTKQFTGVAVLKLAEAGKLSLDDPLSRWFPEYPDEAAEGVTVRHLLTHTAGIPNLTDLPTWAPQRREDATVDEMIAMFSGLPREFEPGTDWAYSNSGYILLGALVEKASGETYEEYVETEIFEPLGMSSSRYERNTELVPRRAEGYDGAPGDWRNAEYISMTQPHGAGALISSVDDLARWDEALRAGEVLAPEWLEIAWTPYELADGRDSHYAAGWAVGSYLGHRLVLHSGGIDGYLSHALHAPQDDLYVAILSNNPTVPPGPLAMETALDLLGAPLETRKSIELPTDALERLTGVYEVGGDPEDLRVISLEDGELFSQRTGGAKTAIRPVSRTEFFFVDSPTTIHFEEAEDGTITGHVVRSISAPESRAVKTDRPVPEERRAIEVSAEVLERYVGRYEVAPSFALTFTREGDQLYTQATGQPRFEIFPETESRFFLKVVDAVVEFQMDDDGAVTGLVLYQAGQEIPATRVE